MQPIPQPELLDPDRPLRPHGTKMTEGDPSESDLLKSALKDTCDYAQQLWNDLDGVRAYLHDSLPPDPRGPGPHPTASASPTGPDDGTGWSKWITAYATVTSVLAGPHGDSGYGFGESTSRGRTPPQRTRPGPARRAPVAGTADVRRRPKGKQRSGQDPNRGNRRAGGSGAPRPPTATPCSS